MTSPCLDVGFDVRKGDVGCGVVPPQMGRRVSEHRCGIWQRAYLGGWAHHAMAHALVQIIPSPSKPWRTCWGLADIHYMWTQMSVVTPDMNPNYI